MQNFDVQVVLTEKLQECLLFIFQIKIHADYSKISNPYVLKDFMSRKERTPKFRENVPMFKAQNLHCNVMIALTGDILDTSPPWGYRPKRAAVSFSHTYISRFIKTTVGDARLIPIVLLILHCDLAKNFLFDKISKSVRSEYLNVRTFVLSPGKVENNLIFSGYYICWFYITCRVPFHCHGSDCVNIMMETFDLATNFGKRFAWKHDPFQEHFEKEAESMVGSPFRRKNPWILLKTIYHFLIEDFYCNCSILLLKTNSIIIGYSKNDWAGQPTPIFQTSGFHFITSDGVQASRLEMISLYTTPLELVVWIAVSLSTIFTAIALASDAPSLRQQRKGVASFLFSVFANLMEQGSFIATNPMNIFRSKYSVGWGCSEPKKSSCANSNVCLEMH
ncbi:unnamed protein product [Allacma fusca]|uniref:Uncharacterized protein n=1 Tax=Allacma fusca TaxID=39272 RepID=A0A8J2KDP6_9HEXA|nr:unnamed protein product [Allacma fusca]